MAAAIGSTHQVMQAVGSHSQHQVMQAVGSRSQHQVMQFDNITIYAPNAGATPLPRIQQLVKNGIIQGETRNANGQILYTTYTYRSLGDNHQVSVFPVPANGSYVPVGDPDTMPGFVDNEKIKVVFDQNGLGWPARDNIDYKLLGFHLYADRYYWPISNGSNFPLEVSTLRSDISPTIQIEKPNHIKMATHECISMGFLVKIREAKDKALKVIKCPTEHDICQIRAEFLEMQSHVRKTPHLANSTFVAREMANLKWYVSLITDPEAIKKVDANDKSKRLAQQVAVTAGVGVLIIASMGQSGFKLPPGACPDPYNPNPPPPLPLPTPW